MILIRLGAGRFTFPIINHQNGEDCIVSNGENRFLKCPRQTRFEFLLLSSPRIMNRERKRRDEGGLWRLTRSQVLVMTS